MSAPTPPSRLSMQTWQPLLALPPLERFVAVLELWRGLVEPEHEQRALYARLREVLRFRRPARFGARAVALRLTVIRSARNSGALWPEPCCLPPGAIAWTKQPDSPCPPSVFSFSSCCYCPDSPRRRSPRSSPIARR
jgi:hypothetical protein